MVLKTEKVRKLSKQAIIPIILIKVHSKRIRRKELVLAFGKMEMNIQVIGPIIK